MKALRNLRFSHATSLVFSIPSREMSWSAATRSTSKLSGTASEITAALANSLAPGSYLVLSMGAGDQETATQLAANSKAATIYNHSPEQIAKFFHGLELLAPGLTDARDWESAPFPLHNRQGGGVS